MAGFRRPNGSVVGAIAYNSSPLYNYGLYGIYEQNLLQQGSIWPVSLVSDPNFKFNILMIHADNAANNANNNTFLDSSSNNLTITPAGNPYQGTFSPFSQSAGNWSVYFTDSNYLTLGTAKNYSTATDFTFEVWINLTRATQSGQYGTIFNGGIGNFEPELNYIDGVTVSGFSFNNFGQGAFSTGSGNAFFTGRWHHFVVTRTGSTWRAFVDGVLKVYVASATSTANFATIGGASNATSMTGYLSNFRLCDGVLAAYSTASTTVGATIFTPPTASLTAIQGCTFLGLQNNRYMDAVSSAQTFTPTGTLVSVQPFSPFAPSSAYSAASIGGSLYFNGTDYVQTDYSAALLPSTAQDFSIEFWVYPLANSRQDWFNLQASAGFNRLLLCYDGTNFNYSSGDTAAAVTRISSAATLYKQWYHVSLARSGGATKLFVNGVQAGSTYTDTTNWTNNLNFTSGKDPAGTTYVTGYISNIRYVRGTALGIASYPVSSTPLTAVTNTALLLSATNSSIVDTTAKNNIITIGTAAINTSIAKFGGSMSFNGTTDYLIIQNSVLFNFSSNNFTIEGWVYFNDLSTSRTIIERRTPNGYAAGDWVLYTINAAIVFACFEYNSVGNAVLTSSVLSTLTWYHFALVRNTTTLTLYINGTSAQSVTAINLANSTQNVSIGRDVGSGNRFFMNGYIDELRVSLVARYTANFTLQPSVYADQ